MFNLARHSGRMAALFCVASLSAQAAPEPAKPADTPWPKTAPSANSASPVAISSVPSGSLAAMPAAVPPSQQQQTRPIACSKKQQRRKACPRTKS